MVRTEGGTKLRTARGWVEIEGSAPARAGLILVLLVVLATGCFRTTQAAPSGVSRIGVCGSVDLSSETTLADICRTGTLRVVTSGTDGEMRFNVRGNQWEGFGADVANEIAIRFGVRADITRAPARAVAAESWGGRWDVSVGSVTDTPPDDAHFTFAPPPLYLPVGAAVDTGNSTIRDLSDLNGRTICVVSGSSAEAYLKRTLTLGEQAPPFTFEIDDPTIVPTPSELLALADLSVAHGARCEAAVTSVAAIARLAEGGGVTMVGPELFAEPLPIATDDRSQSDNTSLSTALSQIISDMRADGTLAALSTKWYGDDFTSPSSPSPEPSQS